MDRKKTPEEIIGEVLAIMGIAGLIVIPLGLLAITLFAKEEEDEE